MAWRIDRSHSSVMFAARHMGLVTLRGLFTGAAGEVEVDKAAGLPTRVELVIDAASLESGDADRDEKLRGPEYLDAERQREIRFTGRQVAPTGEGRCRVAGELTIRGLTRGVELDLRVSEIVVDHRGQRRVGLATETVIDRRDWGMTARFVMSWGAVMVGEEVTLNVEVEAVEETA